MFTIFRMKTLVALRQVRRLRTIPTTPYSKMK